MNSSRFLVILLLAALSSGCVVVTSYAKLEPQLTQWEEQREYGRSLDALGKVDPKDPDYPLAAKKRMHIERLATRYEQQVRKETSRKLDKGDWAAALDQYDEALKKYPGSAVIRDGLAKLHQQQQEQLEQLELKRLIQHGIWLHDVIPVYKDIARINPRSSDAQSRLKRIEAEAADIARELAVVGNKSLANNDLKTADATLPLALSLSGDPVIEGSVNSLRSELKKLEQKRIASRRYNERQADKRRQQKEQAVKAIRERYDQAVAKRDYVSAREQLAEFERVDRRHPELKTLKKSLRKSIEQEITLLFDTGVSAYSRGQFEQAAKQWREVLRLDPEHAQAKENLDRAEKVLENLQRLKEKQGN